MTLPLFIGLFTKEVQSVPFSYYPGWGCRCRASISAGGGCSAARWLRRHPLRSRHQQRHNAAGDRSAHRRAGSCQCLSTQSAPVPEPARIGRSVAGRCGSAEQPNRQWPRSRKRRIAESSEHAWVDGLQERGGHDDARPPCRGDVQRRGEQLQWWTGLFPRGGCLGAGPFHSAVMGQRAMHVHETGAKQNGGINHEEAKKGSDPNNVQTWSPQRSLSKCHSPPSLF